MSSAACQKLPSLPRLAPADHSLPHHSTLFPFLSAQDPLPCTRSPHSFLSFCPPSPAKPPFVRTTFEDAVCGSLPDFAGAQHATSGHVRTHAVVPTTEHELESAGNSACNSDILSSDFCMSSSSDDDEDDTSSSSSTSALSKFERSSAQEGPLDSLASLSAALPIKRGLSRHFSGKSQSFSSLARVSSVAELAKPENPYAKRRRTAGVGADSLLKHHSYPPRCSSSAGISKRPITTCNRFKYSLKSLSPQDRVVLEGLAKCFSVPEF